MIDIKHNLELLRLEFPETSVPEVILVQANPNASSWYRPSRSEIYLPAGFSLGALYHEWRHHWQKEKGYKNDSMSYGSCSTRRSYKDSIIAYYKVSKCEQDSLYFETSRMPDTHNTRHLEWVTQELNKTNDTIFRFDQKG